ncbi:hypothetical protein SH467x_001387 [Pirellulaceae bacterium SH467]|jgi:hypothetical protein
MQFESDASSPSSKLLERFFTGLSEYAFYSQLGVTDTELVTYVSNLLIRFTKTDALHRIRQLNGRRATEVVTMMAEAQHRVGMAKREVHRHIGDFTLFWTGLYPESLRGLQTDKSDHFVSYCHEGKKAYEIASEIESDDEQTASSDLLHRLSEQFEMCAYGLREIRRQWEEKPAGDEPILF